MEPTNQPILTRPGYADMIRSVLQDEEFEKTVQGIIRDILKEL